MPPPLPPGFVLEGSTRPVGEFNSDVALPMPAPGQFSETYPAWVSTPAATAKPSGPPSSRAALPALPPGFELETAKPKEDVGYVTSAVRGAAEMIPLLGAAPRHLNAITQAAAEPLLSNDPTISHKPTFAERRAENLAREEALSKTAEEQHPVVSTVAGLAGGLGAGGALLKAAPAAANIVFGLGAKTLPGQIAAGAASGAGVGGLDAALRGEDPAIAAGVGGGLGGTIPLAGRGLSNVVNRVRDARALRDPALARQMEDAAARAVEVPGGTAAGEARPGPGGAGGDAGVAQAPPSPASPLSAVQPHPTGAPAAAAVEPAAGQPATGWWRAAGLTDAEAQRALENIERTHAPVTAGPQPEPIFPSQEIQRGTHIDSMPTQRAPGEAPSTSTSNLARETAARVFPPPQALEGLPRKPIDLGEHGVFTPGPSAAAHAAARDYAQTAGIKYEPIQTYQKVVPERAQRIAAEFEKMAHEPDHPEVKASYDALINETAAQWEAIKKTGLKIEFIKPGMADPYEASPRLANLDVQKNNHLWVYPTDHGFGTGATGDALKNNPMLRPMGEINGRPVVANDIFRIVHDYFGHIKNGVGFRADGEENAWRAHSAMYSDIARPAMTAETRGQNSWVNYGPHGDKNRTASSADTVYADQKVGRLPSWVMEEGRADPAAAARSAAARSAEGVAAPAPAVGAQASPAVDVAAAAPPRPAPVSTAGPVRSSGTTDVPSVPSIPGVSNVPLFEGSHLTTDGIKQAAQNGYRAIDQQGVRISPDATIGIVNRIANEMNAQGFRPAYQPAVFRVLRRIAERETQGGSTFGDLMADLQYLNGLRTGVPDKNYAAAGVVKRAIENFMGSVKQADVVAGNPHQAVKILQEANKNWSVYRIAEKIEQQIALGKLNANTGGNGRSNTTNAMLQAIKPMLKAVEQKKLYVTPEVHQALKDVVLGKYGVARTLSKFAPTGVVSIGSSYLLGQGLPGDEHGITGALGLAALGLAAKKRVDRKTMERVAKLLATAKSASPAQQRFQALQPKLPSGGRISFGSLSPLDEQP